MGPRRSSRVLATLFLLLAALVSGGCSLLGLFDKAPTASIKILPSSGITVGKEVTFDASSSSDPQSYPLDYEWSLSPPSGSNASIIPTGGDQLVKMTPDVAGTYTVLLKVTARSQSRKSDQISKSFVAGAASLADQEVAADKNALAIRYASGDSASSVTMDLVLPTSGSHGTIISWTSDHASVLSSKGAVSRPPADTTVTLTALITKGDSSDTRSFTVTVIAAVLTDAQAVALDKDALEIDFASGDSATCVRENVTLPVSGANDTMISWVSSNESIVNADGTVNQPATTDAEVTLTATIMKGTASDTKVFTLTIVASNSDPVVGNWVLSLVDGQTAVAAGKLEIFTINSGGSWSALAVWQGSPYGAYGTWSTSGSGKYTFTYTSGGPTDVSSEDLALDSGSQTLTGTYNGSTYVFARGSMVLPPTGLTVSDESANVTAIALSWSPSLCTGVSGYRIWRGTSAGSETTLVATTSSSATQYLDSGLEWNRTYYYAVSAVSGTTESLVKSNEASASTPNAGTVGVTID